MGLGGLYQLGKVYRGAGVRGVRFEVLWLRFSFATWLHGIANSCQQSAIEELKMLAREYWRLDEEDLRQEDKA